MEFSNETNVDNLLKRTLEKSGVPVERIIYSGEASQYITFQSVSSQDEEHSDDEAGALEHDYRADIFSKGNYTELLKQTRRNLKKAGFYDIETGPEFYEKDTGLYHVPLDLSFMEVFNNADRT